MLFDVLEKYQSSKSEPSNMIPETINGSGANEVAFEVLSTKRRSDFCTGRIARLGDLFGGITCGILGIVLAFFIAESAYSQELEIHKGGSATIAELRIAAANRPCILQGTSSLDGRWKSLFLSNPDIDGELLPINKKETTRSRFFRLAFPEAIESPTFHVNISQTSNYLGRLEFPGLSQFYFFGERDESGLAESIESISYNIEGTSYQTDNYSIYNTPFSPPSSDSATEDLDTLSGSIEVVWGQNCPQEEREPKLQWFYINPADGTAQTGFYGTTRVAIGDIGALYSFDLKVSERPDWNTPYEMIGDSLWEAISEMLPGNPAEVALEGASEIINNESPQPKVVSKAMARLQMAGFIYNFGENMARKYDAPHRDLYGYFPNLKIRAVIMDGDVVELSSEWISFDENIPVIDDNVKLHIDASCKAKTFTVTKSYNISDGFNDAARVKLLNFDFSKQLAAFPESRIDKVDWSIEHRISAVDVTLETDHPSGSNGSFDLWRWLNGLSSLTPGFVVPQEVPFNIYSGLFPSTVSKSFQFSLAQSPYKLSFEGDSKPITITESNPARLGAYRSPFTIEIIAFQHAVLRSHVRGLAPPVIKEQSKANFNGSITIKVFTK